jgi:hypothetical protein
MRCSIASAPELAPSALAPGFNFDRLPPDKPAGYGASTRLLKFMLGTPGDAGPRVRYTFSFMR